MELTVHSHGITNENIWAQKEIANAGDDGAVP
jgi:hypothetical protein